MSLPTISGRGFLISDIDFKFLPSGQAVANFPVAFNKSKKNEQTGEWDRTHEIVFRAAAWGKLAEFIAENFSEKTEIELSGEVYLRKYPKQDGTEGQSVELTVRTVGAPIVKRDSNGGGNGGLKWGSNPASNPAADWA